MRRFLRYYLDAMFYQQKPDRRKRTRVYDEFQFAPEETAPLNAPQWTKSGYNGSMKAVIKKAVLKYNYGNNENVGYQVPADDEEHGKSGEESSESESDDE